MIFFYCTNIVFQVKICVIKFVLVNDTKQNKMKFEIYICQNKLIFYVGERFIQFQQ